MRSHLSLVFATLAVSTVGFAAPLFTKAFNPSTISIGGTSTLTFTITNQDLLAETNIGFTDTFPVSIATASPAGLTSSCGGLVVATSNNVTLSGGALNVGASCTITVNVVGISPGIQTNITSTISSSTGVGGVAFAVLTVLPLTNPGLFSDAYQIGYAANLNIGDSVVNITNAGYYGGFVNAGTSGNICVNVYTFDPQEEEIGCCACLVTPNGLNSLSVKQDLISNNLTPAIPTSVVIKLVATSPAPGLTSVCNPALVAPGASLVTPTPNTLAPGMTAWGSTLEPAATAGTYGPVGVPFLSKALGISEMTALTQVCNFIQANGSGFGICKSCRLGALGGAKQ